MVHWGEGASAPAASSHQKKQKSNNVRLVWQKGLIMPSLLLVKLKPTKLQDKVPPKLSMTYSSLMSMRGQIAWKIWLPLEKKKIECLTNLFTPVLEKVGCNVALIPQEWLSLKVQVNSGFWDKDYKVCGKSWQQRCHTNRWPKCASSHWDPVGATNFSCPVWTCRFRTKHDQKQLACKCWHINTIRSHSSLGRGSASKWIWSNAYCWQVVY